VQRSLHSLTSWLSIQDAVRALAWSFAVLALLNVLYYVLRVSNPIIQADDWWQLSGFVRKALSGSLGFADFFVKRSTGDHAMPLYRVLLLFEWRYFDLDYVPGAVVGVIAGAASAVILYRVVVTERYQDDRTALRYLAWAAMCTVLFSLNGLGVWTWPLAALQNITTLIIFMFMLAAWRAYQSQRYLTLGIATLLLGISSDDSALIAILATVLGLLLAWFRDSVQQRSRDMWKALAVIGICMLLVRIGYACAPVGYPHALWGDGPLPLASRLRLLPGRFQEGGWWQWVALPLILPVYYQSPFQPVHAQLWMGIQSITAVLLLIAHVLFWRQALQGKYNRPVFVAVCLMLLTYGWVAGILLGRVSVFGNDYLNEPRYVLLYAGHLVALLLMWAGSFGSAPRPPGGWPREIGTSAAVTGCLILMVIQVPLSIDAWHMRSYEWGYYAKMADRIDALARDPVHADDCGITTLCRASPEMRRELTQLLSENRLNIYSPRVQRWHSYLPKLSSAPPMSTTSAPPAENADRVKK
jgi:hypothetical protein